MQAQRNLETLVSQAIEEWSPYPETIPFGSSDPGRWRNRSNEFRVGPPVIDLDALHKEWEELGFGQIPSTFFGIQVFLTPLSERNRQDICSLVSSVFFGADLIRQIALRPGTILIAFKAAIIITLRRETRGF